ncbi:isocitrate lyase/phosphoenolpyruvate mutase family protein [Empedobacter stercoris]|uniref:Isocitrate lyase/phosphoenolpyruvate mutase family protein n=2 Tax=Empedobacter TaxID=59734 RepID=A0ABY8VBK2_9FLAO|nr:MULTISPECIES: isocitrate lyase/phosphoenolpyruvate mutase family protein [Empedobacter]MCA4776561.1 isocitrate lyase/phosphoenolpyruvate mutase family protein [Empedobacter stercoris]MCA4782038.1 isocitrate lyase/phosphoenolpyruvate mutase family protein [Empedobacter stercoris]MCA4808975.1 isocitrate lyase/phosphoenolpyruvate mutase family protein [Empedobacter stercoris]MDM1521941.1 isocitrate lyase/phosphoenolpyruvate mutase family protein [Empedobacter sp. 225-1]MDM1542210.1 isocitrate 
MSLENFKKLHNQNYPLVIANVWDIISAKAAEEAGFLAVGTSSHAIANMLGYEDGQNISFYEMLYIIERISKSTSLLVSADIESGFTEDLETLNDYIEKLVDAGVVGINLEDGNTDDDNRKLSNQIVLEKKIKSIKEYLNSKNKDIFINARIDTYTTKVENPLEETLKRAKLYKEAGADGIFVPLIEEKSDIENVINQIELPLNIFITPKLSSYKIISELGVHRISSGNKVHQKVTDFTNEFFKELLESKDFSKLL